MYPSKVHLSHSCFEQCHAELAWHMPSVDQLGHIPKGLFVQAIDFVFFVWYKLWLARRQVTQDSRSLAGPNQMHPYPNRSLLIPRKDMRRLPEW